MATLTDTLTLVEARKRMPDTIERVVVDTFARSHLLYSFLPFQPTPSGVTRFNRKTVPPVGQWRAINSSVTRSVVTVDPRMERVALLSDEFFYDRFLTKTQGGLEGEAQAESVAGMGHNFVDKFIKGDSVADSNEFDGLQVRLPTSSGRTTDLGNTALTMDSIDNALQQTPASAMATTSEVNPSGLIMLTTDKVIRLLTAFLRTSVTLSEDRDTMQRLFYRYAGVPLISMDQVNSVFTTMDDQETATTSSIYVCALGTQAVTGIQVDTPDVIELPAQSGTPGDGFQVEWYPGIAIKRETAVHRIAGIDVALAVTA